jgi:hypothetical protein
MCRWCDDGFFLLIALGCLVYAIYLMKKGSAKGIRPYLLLAAFMPALGCGPNSGRRGAQAGPLLQQVRISEHSYSWTCQWDRTKRNDVIRLYRPVSTTTPLPVVAFHHGRGLGFRDYDTILSELASNGVVVASVSDTVSFYTVEAPADALPIYDLWSPSLGMVSASYALERALAEAEAVEPMADPANAYLAGHSRGGGAVEACHARNVKVRGFAYLMPFDIYGLVPMPTLLPPTKVLAVAATQDANLGFASTAGITQHFAGQYVFDVIYGGNHDYVSDARTDGPASITRRDEQDQVVAALVALTR